MHEWDFTLVADQGGADFNYFIHSSLVQGYPTKGSGPLRSVAGEIWSGHEMINWRGKQRMFCYTNVLYFEQFHL